MNKQLQYEFPWHQDIANQLSAVDCNCVEHENMAFYKKPDDGLSIFCSFTDKLKLLIQWTRKTPNNKH